MSKVNNNLKLIITVLILVAIGLMSFFYLSNVFSSASFHATSIDYLDSKKGAVVSMTGAVCLASIGLSAIPGDTFTPMAGQLASLTNWMLLISIIVIMEKYLLIITGYIAFKFLIPIACGSYIAYLLTHHNFLRALGIKLAIFGIAMFLIVPTSVKLCKVIESTQLADLQETVATVDNDSVNNNEDSDIISSNNSSNILGTINIFDSKFWSNLKTTIKNSIIEPLCSITAEVKNKVATEISDFVDKVAVLVVTSCIIPILVMIAFGYLLKMVFGITINPSPKLIGWLNNKTPKLSLENSTAKKIE